MCRVLYATHLGVPVKIMHDCVWTLFHGGLYASAILRRFASAVGTQNEAGILPIEVLLQHLVVQLGKPANVQLVVLARF